MARPELVNYIKKTLGMGYSIEAVRKALVNSGWPEEEIEKGFMEVLGSGKEKPPEDKKDKLQRIMDEMEEREAKQAQSKPHIQIPEKPTEDSKVQKPILAKPIPSKLKPIVEKEETKEAMKEPASFRDEFKGKLGEEKGKIEKPEADFFSTYGKIIIALIVIIFCIALVYIFLKSTPQPAPVGPTALNLSLIPPDSQEFIYFEKSKEDLGKTISFDFKKCEGMNSAFPVSCQYFKYPSGECYFLKGSIDEKNFKSWAMAEKYSQETYGGRPYYFNGSSYFVVFDFSNGAQCTTIEAVKKIIDLYDGKDSGAGSDSSIGSILGNIDSDGEIILVSNDVEKVNLLSKLQGKNTGMIYYGFSLKQSGNSYEIKISFISSDINKMESGVRGTLEFEKLRRDGEEEAKISELIDKMEKKNNSISLKATISQRVLQSIFGFIIEEITLEKKIDICKNEKDVYKKNACYKEILDLIGNSSQCSKIDELAWNLQCKITFCTDYSNVESTCSNYSQNEKDICLQGCAQNIKGISKSEAMSLCKQISSGNTRDSCLKEMAKQLNELVFCANIENSIEKDVCFMKINATADKCLDLEDRNIREPCIVERIGTMYKNDAYAICSQILNNSLKIACIEKAGKLNDRPVNTNATEQNYYKESDVMVVNFTDEAKKFSLFGNWADPTVRIVIGKNSPNNDYIEAAKIACYISNRAYNKSEKGFVVQKINSTDNIVMYESMMDAQNYLIIGTPSSNDFIKRELEGDSTWGNSIVKKVDKGVIIAGKDEYELQKRITEVEEYLNYRRDGVGVYYNGVTVIGSDGIIKTKVVVGKRASRNEMKMAGNLASLISNLGYRIKMPSDKKGALVQFINITKTPMLITDAERSINDRYIIIGPNFINPASPINVSSSQAVIGVYGGNLVIAGGTFYDTKKAINEYLKYLESQET